MKRVDFIAKDQCNGCSACFSICPQKCINMQPDNEGFLYPTIIENNCINCELCYNTCPSNDKDKNITENNKNELYACWLSNDNLRSISSSGGAFSALSFKVLEKNGLIVGVCYSHDFKQVNHSIIHNINELDKFRRSKLVQSNKKDIFQKTKDLLEKKKLVLFTGTPCEIAGLNSYLKKKYNNLITIDLICGCVASPKVYKNYIDFLETKYKSKVLSVNFKDKSIGWQERSIRIDFENGEVYKNSTDDDPYIVSFHSRYNIRPSCFKCKFRGLERPSDITLGDFWGIKYLNNKIDDNKGISFVMINTKKGKNLLNETKDIMNLNKIRLDINKYSKKYNVSLTKSPAYIDTINREDFFSDLEVLNFSALFDKYLKKIWIERKKKKQEYLKKLENDKFSQH